MYPMQKTSVFVALTADVGLQCDESVVYISPSYVIEVPYEHHKCEGFYLEHR